MKKAKLHQLKLQSYAMSYVLETGDGRLIVIDGGMPEEAEPLYRYLQQISGKAVPEIAAWIITHLHIDHDGALLELRKLHPRDLVIKQLICCYPQEEMMRDKEPACLREWKAMEEVKDIYGCEHITPAAGERYRYGELELEILFTCAEFSPERRDYNMNDTSTVFRVWTEGQSVLFLGDSEPRANEILIRNYGSKLKSDAVQLAHHGGPGSTSELYALVDARLVLWPHDEESAIIWLYWREANRAVYASGRIEDTFIAGYGTRVKELPLQPDYAPYLMEKAKLHREAKTSWCIKKAEKLPKLSDFSDPAWEQSPEINACAYYEGRRRGAHATLRVLWSEKELYLKLDLFRDPMISDPACFDKDHCNNVRVHLMEEPVWDMTLRWSPSVEEGRLQGLVLYPEEKLLPQGPAFNGDPAHITSFGKTDKDHAVICAGIPFAKAHQKGDLIGFHTEVNLILEEKGGRDVRMYLDPDSFFPYYRSLPAGIMLWQLS